jgi:mannan endo-1,6-alpha-mannosidase
LLSTTGERLFLQYFLNITLMMVIRYDYKNVAANGGFFFLASRLARYTGNTTYIEWAEKTWDWFSTSVLYDNATHQINDGTSIEQGCTQADHTQWSYNYGFFVGGLAFLFNTASDSELSIGFID